MAKKIAAPAKTSSITAVEAIEQIHAAMDGKEWDSDTTDEIAQILREAGYRVRDPETYEAEEGEDN